MPRRKDAHEQVVDAAIALAEASSWEAVRLHDVAARSGLELADVHRHFRDKDEVADAWFDRADAAMLAAAQPAGGELAALMMSWFDALGPHRRVARQILLGKLEPGHLHVQVPALLRVSRTVQWLREAAGRRATGLARALEEAALSAIFLAALVHWLGDETPGCRATRRFIERRVAQARLLAWCWPARTAG